MANFSATVLACLLITAPCAGAVSYRTFDGFASDASAAPQSMDLVSRFYVPYNLDASSLAFGMGAAEQISYDPDEKYVYAVSEQGVVNVVDYNNPTSPVLEPTLGIDLTSVNEVGGLTDVEVCGQWLFVSMSAATKTDPGFVRIYKKALREDKTAPLLDRSVAVGPLPDMIKPNNACTKVAVANEAEGTYSQELLDPPGSVSIIDIETGDVTPVSFESIATNDDELMNKGVHLPLPLKAMEYFDLHSKKFKDQLDFASARANYKPVSQLEPEYVLWSPDDSKIYVNLQENSALVEINANTGIASSISAYPLKDWSASGATDGIDTVKDDQCLLEHKPGFASLRMPDSIAVVSIDGQTYILTADEGDDKEYGKFESKQKFKDVIENSTSFGSDFEEFTADAATLSEAYLNFGGTKMRITIGSTAVNYTNPEKPVFKQAVGFGGRGISIINADTKEEVWNSGSAFEKEQCEAYPWAHNGVQDEEFAALSGTLYNSASTSAKTKEAIEELNDPDQDGCSDGGNGMPGACPLGRTVDERSLKDGAGPESIVAGIACGRLLAVTATEKQGTAFIYDISEISSPKLLFVHHLSPASETKNPGVAYDDRTLGDIDPESAAFLESHESPTGNAGIMFGGAWSGTVSFYEFKDASGNKCQHRSYTEHGTSGSFRMFDIVTALVIMLAAVI
uniref:Alkaline phosphatase n=1 Tax=Karenia mikimotoi TaxID=225107 RepID=A0A0N9HP24_KARMI|nr:alkaline phosphatase [Karenia mikimotoi]